MGVVGEFNLINITSEGPPWFFGPWAYQLNLKCSLSSYLLPNNTGLMFKAKLCSFKSWWSGSSNRSFVPYCDIHPSETDYRKRKNLGWGLASSISCCWLDFEIWVWHSKREADECKLAGAGFKHTKRCSDKELVRLIPSITLQGYISSNLAYIPLMFL